MYTWEEERRRVWAMLFELRDRIKTIENIVVKEQYSPEQPEGPEQSGGPLYGEALGDRLNFVAGRPESKAN